MAKKKILNIKENGKRGEKTKIKVGLILLFFYIQHCFGDEFPQFVKEKSGGPDLVFSFMFVTIFGANQMKASKKSSHLSLFNLNLSAIQKNKVVKHLI